MPKPTYEELAEVIIDLCDGESWWDIQGSTGCSEERSKQIYNIYKELQRAKGLK